MKNKRQDTEIVVASLQKELDAMMAYGRRYGYTRRLFRRICVYRKRIERLNPQKEAAPEIRPA